MIDLKNVDGHYYPPFHRGWGGFAEELFHYTSRYYCATEAFLRHLADRRNFTMHGYRAARLSDRQRDVMAAVLSSEPDRAAALTLTALVDRVLRGDPEVERAWLERYASRLQDVARAATVEQHVHPGDATLPEVAPPDPFLSMAERLQMPVAVREHHVELSMQVLAQHLDSANPTIRTNLRNAIVQLHNAGYLLRNHPQLTHSEAHEIGDEDAV